MLKFVFTVLLTIVALLFALQNFHSVPVGFFTGHVQVRLIFVILSCVILGAMSPILYGMARKVKISKSAPPAEEAEDDIFDEDE